MPERTDHSWIDTALHKMLTEPSWPARLLCSTAACLENGQPFMVLDIQTLSDAEEAAKEQVLADLPDIVAQEAEDLASLAMPMLRPRETGGEYALRLRAIAGTV
ncbi:hypothetical protein GCM10011583_11740 [Streptomyces camponoticapitis]|uniref:Uncharacterized protein n=1 Tax=Streptomyces camponoticapitis TaxID=1616125 RepID=A0ABQ2E392_9ACTN|nr:hypothetical protein [Streptomyces camponoticapitis]GGJ81925.1 hypothetical protein GCM10011583_11740 [Streptomyces camponoticapitis]